MFDQSSLDHDATTQAPSGGADRRTGDRWHVSREIVVGHLLLTLALMTSLTYCGALRDVRLTRLEGSITSQTWTDTRQDDALTAVIALINLRLNRMEDKLDRLIETADKGDG